MRPIIILIISTGTLALAGCGQQAARPETKPVPSAEVSTNTPPQNAPPVVAAASVDFSKLKGRWERPDGGYVLEIRGIAADGQADAGYFNPAPIRVERARAERQGDTLKVFLMLRDTDYPGCTYTLTYDAQNDQLVGQYFQATLQQTYDITFARLK